MRFMHNYITRYLLSIVILFELGSITVFCQNPSPPPPPAAATPTKRIGKADVFYFADGNMTLVTALNIGVWKQDREWLTMHLQFRVPGNKVIAPDVISLSLSSNRKKGFSASDKLLIRVGDNEFQYDQRKELNPHINNWVDFIIPYTTFLKFVDTKEIKMSIGSIEFKLTKESVEALRDMRRAIEP